MTESTNQQKPEQTELALSLLTVPFLGALFGSRSLLDGLTSLGEASEEIFRGDRLPILHLEQHNDIEIKA
ncbi:hypothetical protein FRE64_03205 [Euhalothece natronophila Z-M001]|uniref:Uncharacterized protein n=1 Tax=Euhalothece natronophila Z-M001 TaxID=522448 RepID=A0A5B8NL68_9CHRO|nr:hypothetical protein [Euhalothece natronophila]QDZ39030.1 hypothetical protein FRE64_03205 [Euhalothece natronophila Z-M001]